MNDAHSRNNKILNAASVLNNPRAFAVYYSIATGFPDGCREEDLLLLRKHWWIGRKGIKEALCVLRDAGLIQTRWGREDANPLNLKHVKLVQAA